MTNRDSTALRRYYRSIRGWLPCTWKQKNKILRKIRVNVKSFLEDQPQADFSQIQARFGTPQQIAASYVEDMDTAELLRALRIRKRVVAVVMTTVLTALVLWASVITCEVIETINSHNGYYVVEGIG